MSDRVDNPDEELQQAFSSSSEGQLVEQEDIPLVETVDSRSTSSRGLPRLPREPPESRGPDLQPSSSTSPEPEVEVVSQIGAHEEERKQLDKPLEEPHSARVVQIQAGSRKVSREDRRELPQSSRWTEGDHSRTSRSRPDLNLTSELGSAPARIRDELQLDDMMSGSDFWPTERPSRGRRSSMLIDTPVRRTHRAFVREGLRQSMGKKQLDSTEVETLVERTAEEEESICNELHSVEGALLIDGRPIEISTTGRSEIGFAPV